MKPNRLIMSIAIAMLLSVSLISTSIDALAEYLPEQTYTQYCRCHDDGRCYGGNAISFRLLCAYGEVPDGSIPDCHVGDFVCANM